ncbi:acyl-CoA thioesterase [Saccharicrinis fermentans]|uniref:Acyl-CoA thioester hydrolase YbgC n=1 Tax=Saccharicrinis fermentans DSM 9555 = JCM 21142 TaxID=869213 RepID=W7YRV1_9BACT|nr:thioesterase family protein [Saccharicrinis fermentans]GAF05139.1 acyl-CoA thioester hydrolase YbgC [Saccharicrinis fermentans DSM 9555 = JCM 21142]
MKIFTQPINIRFFDIDMNHHVNNSVYFTYMENARTELLMDEFLGCKEQGLTFVISETSCKYKNPMRLGDRVICEMVFTLKRPVQFEVTYTFKNKDSNQVYAVGYTLVVMINEAKNRPVPIPQEFIDLYVNT